MLSTSTEIVCPTPMEFELKDANGLGKGKPGAIGFITESMEDRCVIHCALYSIFFCRIDRKAKDQKIRKEERRDKSDKTAAWLSVLCCGMCLIVCYLQLHYSACTFSKSNRKQKGELR